MLDLVAGFPGQIGEALELGQRAAIGVAQGPFRAVVVAGMGGSAVGGDILRCALGDVLDIPLITVRGYHLPHMVGPGWLVLCSSYSGNTEETIALYEDARRRRARVICLTAGGRLAEKSSRDGVPWIKLPGGMPPRAALAYSFIPMLTTLWRLDAAPPRWHELDDLVVRVREAGERCAVEVPAADNIAKQLARKLVDRLIVVHASADHLEAVALRWRSQFEENAKQLAFHSLYPEIDHNEVVGWTGGGSVAQNAHVIALRDPEDDPRLKRRIEVTSEIIASCRGAGEPGVDRERLPPGAPREPHPSRRLGEPLSGLAEARRPDAGGDDRRDQDAAPGGRGHPRAAGEGNA